MIRTINTCITIKLWENHILICRLVKRWLIGDCLMHCLVLNFRWSHMSAQYLKNYIFLPAKKHNLFSAFFTSIVRSFGCAVFQQAPGHIKLQNCIPHVDFHETWGSCTTLARLSYFHTQGCHKMVLRIRKTDPSAAACQSYKLRTSSVVIRFTAFLRQPCNKGQGHRAAVLRHSQAIYFSANSYVSRTNTLLVLQQPCVPPAVCVIIRLHKWTYR